MIKRLFGLSKSDQPEPPQITIGEGGPHSAEVYHAAARHFLDVQMNTLDELGSKTAQFLSVESLALPVTFAFLRPSVDSEPLPAEVGWLFRAALAGYVLVLVFAAASSMIRALEYRPNITTLKEHSETYSGIFLMQWVANEYEASIHANNKVLVRKARLVGAEALCFFIEGLCLSAAVVLLL